MKGEQVIEPDARSIRNASYALAFMVLFAGLWGDLLIRWLVFGKLSLGVIDVVGLSILSGLSSIIYRVYFKELSSSVLYAVLLILILAGITCAVYNHPWLEPVDVRVKVYEQNAEQSGAVNDPQTGELIGYVYRTVIRYEFDIKNNGFKDFGNKDWKPNHQLYIVVEPSKSLLALLKDNPFFDQEKIYLGHWDTKSKIVSTETPGCIGKGTTATFTVEYEIGRRDTSGLDLSIPPPPREKWKQIEQEALAGKFVLMMGRQKVKEFTWPEQ